MTRAALRASTPMARASGSGRRAAATSQRASWWWGRSRTLAWRVSRRARAHSAVTPPAEPQPPRAYVPGSACTRPPLTFLRMRCACTVHFRARTVHFRARTVHAQSMHCARPVRLLSGGPCRLAPPPQPSARRAGGLRLACRRLAVAATRSTPGPDQCYRSARPLRVCTLVHVRRAARARRLRRRRLRRRRLRRRRRRRAPARCGGLARRRGGAGGAGGHAA